LINFSYDFYIEEKSFTEDEIDFYINKSIEQCNLAMINKEVPVGCVFVHIPSKKIFVRSHNLTNLTKNATKHAEINCFDYINSISKDDLSKKEFLKKHEIKFDENKDLNLIFSEAALFVSCEPCIMCGYALSLMSILI